MVGDGMSIDVWKDPWVPWLTDFTLKPKDQSVMVNHLLVSSLILPHSRSWDRGRLVELFIEESVDAIQKIPIPSIPRSLTS